jgi:hypothetical protein
MPTEAGQASDFVWKMFIWEVAKKSGCPMVCWRKKKRALIQNAMEFRNDFRSGKTCGFRPTPTGNHSSAASAVPK